MLVAIAGLLLNALVVLGVAKIIPGIRVDGYGSALAVAGVYALLSFALKWILVFFSLPFIIVTFGLFLLVVNAFLLWLTDKLLDSFEITGKVPLALGTLAITIGGIAVDGIVTRVF